MHDSNRNALGTLPCCEGLHGRGSCISYFAHHGDKLPGRDELGEGGLTSAPAVRVWCRILRSRKVVKSCLHHGDREAERIRQEVAVSNKYACGFLVFFSRMGSH